MAEAALRLRRLRAPLAVAGARLRSHPARGLLVVFGVSLATGLLVAVLGGSLIARDRAVQRAVAALPPSERSFRVDNFLLDRYAPADRAATRALASLSSVPPMRGTILHELRIGGELVQLAALDDLGRLVRLRSGRLPRSCRPERCEVVQIGSVGKPRVQEGDIHLVRVGIGTLPTQTLFGDSLVARPVSGEQGVVLLTAGHLAFDRVHAFDAYARDYAWVTPVAPSSVHVWRVGQILDAESRAQDQLAAVSGEFELSGPDRALFEARSAGRISAERMLLVGGEVSALLLGFAVLAAIGLRRGLADESRRLLQRGARRFQLWLFLGAEVASLTLAGALVGLAAGVVAVLVVADRAGLPGEALLGHSLGSSWGIALVPIAWVVATAAVLAAVRAPRGESHLRLIRPLDVAALGAAVAAGIGLARGGLSAQTLAAGGDRTLLLLLPLLVCFAGAVLVGRLVGPLTRLAERASRKGPMSLRLALLALARAPSRTVATAAFLAVSLGLALFAAAYRSTLDAGARDEAAFQVPLDFALGEDTHLVRPLEAAPLSRFQRLAPGVRAYPVLRQSADVPGPGAGVLSPTVLGVPAPAVAALHWRSDYSGLGLRELSRRLGKDGPATLRGLALPQRRLTLRLPVRITGIPLHFDLVVRDTTGDLEPVSLGDRGAGPWDLSASLPAASGPRQLVGLSFQVSSEALANFLHGEVEGAGGRVPTGSLVLGSLRADGRVLTAWHGWKALGGARIRAGRLSYRFGQTQTMFVRLPQPTDGRPLRVIASGDIARSATGGRLTLDFGGATVPALVVGVGRRFPDSESAGEGFVIADESRLSTALDSQLPGTGTPGELWLSVPAASATRVEEELGRPPFSSLSLASRRDIESSLAADPLARGIELTLAAAAIVALLLALVGIGVALVSELRDERGDLVDLESQGVSPETLRKQFRWRAALVVALGALAGIALGLLLSAVAVSLILASGAATAPEPPLRFATPWVVAAAGLGAVLVLTAVLVEAATRAAFRSETPMRASWGLE